MTSVDRMLENVRAWLTAGPARLSIVQWLYGWTEYLLGCIALTRKRDFTAADHFCRASRRVEVDTYARRQARVRLRQFLRFDSDSGLLEGFRRTPSATSLRVRFLSQPFPLNVTLRGTLLPLKAYDPVTGERGVLLLKYNELFRAFHSVYRTEELCRSYSIVLEPSDHRFEDPAYTLFRNWRVVIEARNPLLSSRLRMLSAPFDTVPLNSGDWVDPEVFRPLPGREKVHDLIYIANWSRNKRHELLFELLASIQKPLSVALVGFDWERRREDITALMRKRGVVDRCQIFEKVSATEVNRLLNAARINLMLSRFEFANRALYEAMYADVPTIANRDCKGVDLSCINESTGLQVSDDELADAILDVLDHPERFTPRAWAMEHTHYARSTQILNEKLKQLSIAKGEAWTTDIVPKVNRCDPVYKFERDAERLRPVLDHLAQFLRR